MNAPTLSPALQQFVDDELLRAPLLFDQLVEGAIEHARGDLASLGPLQRSTVGDLMQALQSQRLRMSEYFMRSLREQVAAELAPRAPAMPKPTPVARAATLSVPPSLSLVDEDKVALDVQLSHMIETVRSTAEYELRELQTFVAALVGDMDMARDHNPFRPEAYARAAWSAAQALSLSRGHQVAFMRHAAMPLAQLLRKTYAASTSRLDAMGIEPAAYRTLILPPGSRRGSRPGETTFTPDLHRIRDSMIAPLDAAPAPRAPLAYEGQVAPAPAAAARSEHWRDVARGTSSRADRQSIELVSRLFDAMLDDERVPRDVNLIISRLHGPAMRLTLRDPTMLDEDKHPLWRFIDRLVYEAEMTPDPVDPERVQLLKVAQATVDQLASEPEQNAGLYRWALDRLESFLNRRLTRRLAAAASHIGALQKLEDKLAAGQTTPTTLAGTLDVPQLDTVPAALMAAPPPAPPDVAQAQAWLESLQPGHWVRMFLQGQWVHARLLWPGERREVFLFGDGASDATWAVRRGALLMMRSAALAKSLVQRSMVGSAALRVQEEVAAAVAEAGRGDG